MENALDSLNISVTSYGFIINFFPIYSSMRHRSNLNAQLAVVTALTFIMMSYTLFALVSYFSFGLNVQSSIFENLKQDNDMISLFVRILFLVIFICNIPFAFLAGKECCLIFILEHRECIVSQQIENHFSRTNSFISGYDKQTQGQQHLVVSEIVDKKTYYITTTLLFLGQIIIASLVDDLTLVNLFLTLIQIFGIIGAFSESTISFVFPGLFFLIAAHKKGRRLLPFQKVMGYGILTFGFVYFSISNYFNVLKILNIYK